MRRTALRVSGGRPGQRQRVPETLAAGCYGARQPARQAAARRGQTLRLQQRPDELAELKAWAVGNK